MGVEQAARTVAVVGAGVAGCAAAIRLTEAGVPVALYEAVADPQPLGAGVLLQPTGQHVLQAMGLLDPALAHGARVDWLYGDTAAGRPVLDMRYRHFEPEAYGLGIQRGALMGLLWTRVRDLGVPWRCGAAVQGWSQDATGGVQLDLADGTHADHAALILANGSFSTLRRAMRVRQSMRLFPWGAVWTVLPRPADFEPIELRQRYRGAQQMVGLMPVGRAWRNGAAVGATDDPAEDAQGINLFWSLPLAQAQQWPTAGEPALDALKTHITGLLPQCAPLLRGLTDPAQLRPARYADVWMRQWHDGRVLAIGDCGHGMSPQLGQGANMALIDAHVLSGIVRETQGMDWNTRFARYSQARAAHLRFYTWASRGLTPLFQSHGRAGAWMRDAFFGWGGALPYIRRQSMAALAGCKTGWLWGRLAL